MLLLVSNSVSIWFVKTFISDVTQFFKTFTCLLFYGLSDLRPLTGGGLLLLASLWDQLKEAKVNVMLGC